jgi:hypothetical protein
MKVFVLQLMGCGARRPLYLYTQELQWSTTPGRTHLGDRIGHVTIVYVLYKDSSYPLSLTLPFNCNCPRFNPY